MYGLLAEHRGLVLTFNVLCTSPVLGALRKHLDRTHRGGQAARQIRQMQHAFRAPRLRPVLIAPCPNFRTLNIKCVHQEAIGPNYLSRRGFQPSALKCSSNARRCPCCSLWICLLSSDRPGGLSRRPPTRDNDTRRRDPGGSRCSPGLQFVR